MEDLISLDMDDVVASLLVIIALLSSPPVGEGQRAGRQQRDGSLVVETDKTDAAASMEGSYVQPSLPTSSLTQDDVLQVQFRRDFT